MAALQYSTFSNALTGILVELTMCGRTKMLTLFYVTMDDISIDPKKPLHAKEDSC